MRITPWTESDRSFVYSSWLKSFREAAQNTRLTNAVYYRAQTVLIDGLLADPGCRVLVARSPADDLVIRGYVVGDGSSIHYVYVKSVFRRQGIGTALLDALGALSTFTHLREPCASWLRSRGLEYDGRFFGGCAPQRQERHRDGTTLQGGTFESRRATPIAERRKEPV